MSIKTLLKNIKHRADAVVNKAKVVGQLKKESFDIRIGHYKKVEMSISDLLLKNSRNGELLRYDIVVRYLAIEEYYGRNDIGYSLYKKMQNCRVKDGYAETALITFQNLIRSYDENGYDHESYIQVDKNLNLIDGSHRIALGLFHGYDRITAYILNSNHPVDYRIDWFFENGFTAEEIKVINSKTKVLLESSLKPFSCVIWSPAVPYAEEILEDLNYYGKVVTAKKYTYKPEEYNNVVRAIYAIDDIEKWKIDKKLEYMKPYSPELLAVDLLFEDPEFRIKSKTGLPLSKRGERTKKAIRAKYSRYISNYFFDIVMHIGDNQYQSEYMRHIFEPGISFEPFISIFNRYEYAFAKVDSPYLPVAFPKAVPVGKDIDVLCLHKDIEKIAADVAHYCEIQLPYNVEIKQSEFGIQIRLNSAAHLVFLVDISWRVPGIKDGFVEQAIEKRVYNGDYYSFCDEDELLYRLYCYLRNKKKKYHLDFIKAHRQSINQSLIDEYYPCDITKLIEEED